ncbi:helix-turn-helix transcriptional regulator [Microcoleus sp. F8-D3]
MSQRAFGKILGVSATAVQLWERGDTVPDTENLAKLAARAGYSLEELLRFLDGKPVSDPLDIQDIVNKIRFFASKSGGANWQSCSGEIRCVG